MKSRWGARRRRGGARRKFDTAQIFQLAYCGASDREIAEKLGCDLRTLRRHCAQTLVAARRQAAAEYEDVAVWAQLMEQQPTSLSRELREGRRAARRLLEQENVNGCPAATYSPFVEANAHSAVAGSANFAAAASANSANGPRQRQKPRRNSAAMSEKTNQLNRADIVTPSQEPVTMNRDAGACVVIRLEDLLWF